MQHDHGEQNRTEESVNFEADVWNNAFVLMDTIKLKTCGQARAKHEFVQPADTTLQFLSFKHEHGESLVDHVKRFKQAEGQLEGNIRVRVP